MKCPFCGHAATQVIDTHMSGGGDTVCRRRRCESCSRRFTTYERIELFFPAVAKRDGGRIDYGRNKAGDSMCLASRKHPAPTKAIDEAIARIEEKLFGHGEKEIGSDCVGEPVVRELKRLNKIRYIRSASVYRSFENLTEFRGALSEVVMTNV